MNPLELPRAPDYQIPWHQLHQLPWAREMESCPQDPVHHAEGNVWLHTCMVLEALVGMQAWRELPANERHAVYLACLLHDVGKPATTQTDENLRVTAKGHSRRGALMARRILWELGVSFLTRELVCGLIRCHQLPFYLIERDDARRLAAEISLVARCDFLALVAEADIRGRECCDHSRILDNIELYREYCREEGCFQSPRRFASDHTRYTFFHSDGRHPDVEVWDDTRVPVVVMSGLPGSGKDRYVSAHYPDWPVVSLDALREELDIEASRNQGRVVQAARDLAKEHLRKGERFVWNATNISRRFRLPLLSLLADYHAHIRLVYVEVPQDRLWAQNRSREQSSVVPERAIRAMMDRWEVPDKTEAHELVYSVGAQTEGEPRAEQALRSDF